MKAQRRWVSAAERVGLALLSTLITVAGICLLISTYACVRHWEFAVFAKAFCYLSIVMLYWSSLAWIFTLPLVLLFSNIRSLRFLVVLGLGTLTGPVAIWMQLRIPLRMVRGFGYWFLEGATVSFLSTLLYLLLLRRLQCRRQGSDAI